jgi:16S rRNA (guanine527-N7)-methyltransferase
VTAEVKSESALALVVGAAALGISLSPSQVDRLLAFTEALFTTNEHINLTGIRTPEGMTRKLILDSLSIAVVLPPSLTRPKDGNVKVVDVGSGAGIPGIPLKIAFSHWQIALVESVGKKARFIEQMISHLDLKGATVLAERAEVLGESAEWRDRADLCLARALAPLPVLIELCAPLVAPGGWLVFPKGGNALEEMQAAIPAQKALSVDGELHHVPEEFGLGAGRFHYVGRKLGWTPHNFPRRIGVARSHPIR